MKKLTIIAVAAALMAIGRSAEAQITITSQSALAAGYTAIAGATLTSTFTSVSGLNGTLTSTVYSGSSGGEAFVYSIAQSASASDDVGGLSLGGFAGTTYSIYYITGTGSISAALASYTVSPTGTITISLSTKPGGGGYVTPGGTLDDIVLYDSDTLYDENYAGVLDSVGVPTQDLAPTAVPEASTVMAGALMLLPLGIGAIRAVRKDRTA